MYLEDRTVSFFVVFLTTIQLVIDCWLLLVQVGDIFFMTPCFGATCIKGDTDADF